MYGIIYKIVNSVNEKIYVGQTTQTLHKRWLAHKSAARSNKSKSCIKLKNAMICHGIDNFTVQQIATASSKEELDNLEKFYIKKYDSIYLGYNLQEGGFRGKPSEESKKKMSDTHKRIGNRPPNSPEIRELARQAKLGKPHKNRGKSSASIFSCPVIIDGFIYPSLAVAAKVFNTYENQIKLWCQQRGNPPFECEFLFDRHKNNNKKLREPREKGDPKPCMIDGVRYDSLIQASRILKKDRKTLRPKAQFLKELICR